MKMTNEKRKQDEKKNEKKTQLPNLKFDKMTAHERVCYRKYRDTDDKSIVNGNVMDFFLFRFFPHYAFLLCLVFLTYEPHN